MKSIFTDKATKPTNEMLKRALGNTFEIWVELADFTKESYPDAVEEWHFASEKFGWSFRIKDKKRVLVYFLPRDKFFKTAFVFGQNATEVILKGKIDEKLKDEIKQAKVYAEGRGIRMEVKDQSKISDIKKLVKIKISN